jgi:ADP-heptose:LPS heptosyltransferase
MNTSNNNGNPLGARLAALGFDEKNRLPATRILMCKNKKCKQEFSFEGGEQDFYTLRGLEDPRLCKKCKKRFAATVSPSSSSVSSSVATSTSSSSRGGSQKKADTPSCTSSVSSKSSQSSKVQKICLNMVEFKKAVKIVDKDGFESVEMQTFLKIKEAPQDKKK